MIGLAIALPILMVSSAFSGGVQRVVFVSALAVSLVVFAIGVRRLQMAKFPQLVADASGLTMAALFGVRHIAWDEVTKIGPVLYANVTFPGVAYFSRTRRRPPFPFRSAARSQIGQFFIHAGVRTYMVNEPPGNSGPSFAELHEQVVEMRRQYSRLEKR
jgi:hypothetical protein